MAKKKSRPSAVSKGERSNVNKKLLNAVRNETTTLQRTINQSNSWLRGKNVVLTIPNPNDKETNKKFIRVKANDIWGTPKKYTMKQTASE